MNAAENTAPAQLDHDAFRAAFSCRTYHGDPTIDIVTGRVVGAVDVIGYEPDPRCPEIVVWQVSSGGARRAPGIRHGWTLERVRAEFAQ